MEGTTFQAIIGLIFGSSRISLALDRWSNWGVILILFLCLIVIIIIMFLKYHEIYSRMIYITKEIESSMIRNGYTNRLIDKGKNGLSSYTFGQNMKSVINTLDTVSDELKEANNNLEYIVKVRTEELVKANEALSSEKEKIWKLAYYDSLTGLPNNTYFNEMLNIEIIASHRLDEPLAVLFMDLDGFKMINDSLGHATGDQLLIQVAKRMKSVLRKSDFITRIGGDEFILMINYNGIGDIDLVAKKLLKEIANPFIIGEHECFITASIGIAIYPIDGETTQELVKNADLAMYRAKDGGKNQFCYCNTDMKNKVVESMILSNQLWRALGKNEFEIYYQPQLNCADGSITGAEALIRWHHPTRGLILPGSFIHLAEQTGSISAIGEWVLTVACRQCKEWNDRFGRDITIAVNVSVKQLSDPSMVLKVEKALADSGLEACHLELEITEGILVREMDSVLSVLGELKSLGLEMSIDDFGTEYASMNYLKRLPFDRLKIAMPFVQGLETNEKDQAITAALIILAKNLGMDVIAEGVETKGQHDFLSYRLCDVTQGFYFFKPMPASEMDKILCGNQSVNPAEAEETNVLKTESTMA